MPLPVFKTSVFNHSTNPPSFLAGVAGFEPANTAVKVLCLTTWRHPIIKGGTPYWSISTRLYESQKGLCEDRSLIFSTKHFVPDLRLANYYSQHIRSMVTTNLSNGERPQGFSPPLIWCNTYYTQPFCWPYRILFTCNFQKAFRNLLTFSSSPIWSFYTPQWLRFSYSHQQLVLYTYFYASPQNGLVGITYSGYPRHKDNI